MLAEHALLTFVTIMRTERAARDCTRLERGRWRGGEGERAEPQHIRHVWQIPTPLVVRRQSFEHDPVVDRGGR